MEAATAAEASSSLLTQSLLFGFLDAMFAAGLVVVYRASRVINFAHGGVWVVTYTLFWELFGFHGLTYWLALPATILAGAVLGGAMELVFVRRFFTSARLILTVVTIGLAQLLAAVAHGLPGMLGDHDNRPGSPHSPLSHFAWQTFPVRFTGDYGAIVVLTIVALVLLGLFFRYTSSASPSAGAAQNGDRASELGINVKTLSTVVWAIAGGLGRDRRGPQGDLVAGYNALGGVVVDWCRRAAGGLGCGRHRRHGQHPHHRRRRPRHRRHPPGRVLRLPPERHRRRRACWC